MIKRFWQQAQHWAKPETSTGNRGILALLLCGLSLTPAFALGATICRPQGVALWISELRVLNGDTLVMKTGEVIRVIGVTTPSVDSTDVSASLGRQAWLATEQFIQRDHGVWMTTGAQIKDPSQRRLAYLRDADGNSLASYLISKGLGWMYVQGSNDDELRCLEQAEQRAHKAGKGVWADDHYAPAYLADMTPQNGQFYRLKGHVERLYRTKSGWYARLQEGGLLGMPGSWDEAHQDWTGKLVEARGYLYRGAVENHWYMELSHPSMLRPLADKQNSSP